MDENTTASTGAARSRDSSRATGSPSDDFLAFAAVRLTQVLLAAGAPVEPHGTHEMAAWAEETRRDKARLDWLEANGWRVSVSCWHTEAGKRDNEWTIHTDFENDTIIGRGKTLREAIDEALASVANDQDHGRT